MPNDCIVISSVNNDYLRSDVIDDNSSNDINVDDGSIDNAVSNLDIASADIYTFDDNASSVSDIVTDSSDPNDIDDYVIDISVIDSNERSNVFGDSEDVGDSDCNDIIDDDSHVIDIYSDSIKDNDEISYIDSIDSDEVDDIVNSTDFDVNTTESYRKNCHPFHYVRPSMTIKQIKMMYSEGGGLCWKSIP